MKKVLKKIGERAAAKRAEKVACQETATRLHAAQKAMQAQTALENQYAALERAARDAEPFPPIPYGRTVAQHFFNIGFFVTLKHMPMPRVIPANAQVHFEAGSEEALNRIAHAESYNKLPTYPGCSVSEL